MKIHSAYDEVDVGYIPLPNIVSAIVSHGTAPPAITATAFVFPFFDNGDLMLASNRRRGLEVPGGHRDPVLDIQGRFVRFETLEETAKRECREEAGVEVLDLTPVGYMLSHSRGNKPVGYKYAFPTACQQFFAGLISETYSFTANDECLLPTRVTQEKARGLFTGRTLALLNAAILAYHEMTQHQSPEVLGAHGPTNLI
jgi:8-oxo-dGTP pyrophosphatase MutT (NUDIX family)